MKVISRDDHGAVVAATLVDESIPVEWIYKDSNFASFMGAKYLDKFARNDIAYNFHVCGLTPQSWETHSEYLDPLFNKIGMHHHENLSFVAMVERKNSFPIRGVRFHPEKALFEWSPSLHYPHSETAVLANRKIADFFVGEVRRMSKPSREGFDNFAEVSQYAIYNYPPVFTGVDVNATRGIYTETYLIN